MANQELPEGSGHTVFKDARLAGLVRAVFVILVLIALDQWTKALAVAHLKGASAVPLLPGIIEFLYVENRGAAFGIMNCMRLFFLFIAPLVSILLLIAYTRLPQGKRFLWVRICFIGIIAGALGNFIDRLRQGYVVDFIYFKPIDFPVFNVADIYVTCAAFLLVFLLIFYYQEEEISQIPFFGSGDREKTPGKTPEKTKDSEQNRESPY